MPVPPSSPACAANSSSSAAFPEAVRQPSHGSWRASKLKNAVHLQTDTFRSAVPAPTFSRRESKLVYRAMIAAAGEALRLDYDAILDGTFPKEEFRREALMTLRRLYARATVVHVWCNPKVAYERNLLRQSPVPRESFDRLYRNFELPLRSLRVDSELTPPAEAVLVSLRG